ncbi:MAG: hypothetical protein IT193_12685 [Propionibacteriaceae bacterium]|nr:hypothetical protein [Propionibacteriaceae bacterium]
MRDAILTKLDEHLANGISCEADVVYLLVEIGKYLEQRHDERGAFPEWVQYPFIRFCRNWAAHSFIDRTGSADPLPGALEAAAAEWLERGAERLATRSVEVAITWERLRTELRTFLAQHALDRELSDGEASWRAFVCLLLGVLADTPLVFRGFKLLQLFSFHQRAPTEVMWHLWAAGRQLEGRVPLA